MQSNKPKQEEAMGAELVVEYFTSSDNTC